MIEAAIYTAVVFVACLALIVAAGVCSMLRTRTRCVLGGGLVTVLVLYVVFSGLYGVLNGSKNVVEATDFLYPSRTGIR